jgi:RNA polymerase sigma factor (sigma-70 family)
MTTDSALRSDGSHLEPLSAEALMDLLELTKQGDAAALDTVLRRCVPRLHRWARSRLPASMQGTSHGDDLVQAAVVDAMERKAAFEARHQGALQCYLRQAVMNRILDLSRKRFRRGGRNDDSPPPRDECRSALERTIGTDTVERYEDAMGRLRPDEREAVVGRIELQYSYDDLAVVLNKPSAAAARSAVTRAMKRLAHEMVRA